MYLLSLCCAVCKSSLFTLPIIKCIFPRNKKHKQKAHSHETGTLSRCPGTDRAICKDKITEERYRVSEAREICVILVGLIKASSLMGNIGFLAG